MKSILIPFLLLAVASARAAVAAEWRAGAAAIDLAPPHGIPLAGYYAERGAEGTLDPLFAKSVVIEKDGSAVAIVCLDLISTTRSLVEQSRAAIRESTGLEELQVMICASHAHTGPVLAGRGARIASNPSQREIIDSFTASLPKRIASSVAMARSEMVPARLAQALGRESQLSFNRRFFMRDGSVGWNPGKLNPAIVRPAGPIDPDVAVLEITTPAGDPLAMLVNFAMHPDTTGGNRFSADYPGALARLLSGWRGPKMVSLFANGCCGNLNHLDVAWERPQKGPEEAHRIGVVLAAAVMQAVKSARPLADGPLRARSTTVSLDLPPVDEQDVAAARAVLEKKSAGLTPAFLEQVNAYRTIDIADRKGAPHEVEVQAIALGPDVAWVSLPGEIFVELGLAIKKASPFPNTFLIELANGSIGYIPDRKAYEQGAYEVVSARCAAGSGERLVDAAVDLLRALRQP